MPVDDYRRRTGSVTVCEYGARGDGVHDDSDAFEEALSEARTVSVPHGIYRLTRPLRITKGVVLHGASGAGWGAATILRFDSGVGGVVVESAESSGVGTSGGWSVLRDLRIEAVPASSAKEAHGITLKSRARLQNVLVMWFSGDGIHIVAAQPEGTNANSWAIDFCRSERNGRHGLFLDGADANAGVAVGLDVSDNGGWGVFDSSFLGNTYVACHASANVLGAYKTDNPNQRSVFVGCYSESGYPGSEVTWPSAVFGGMHGAGVVGGSGQLDGEQRAGLLKGPVGARVTIGNMGSNELSSFKPPGGWGETRERYFGKDDPYTSDVLARNFAGLSALQGWGFSLERGVFRLGVTRGMMPTQLFTTPGMGLLNEGHRIAHAPSLDALAAHALPVTFLVGDVVLNSAPVAGAPAGWICSAQGTFGATQAPRGTAANSTTLQLDAGTDALYGLKVGTVLSIDGARRTVVAVADDYRSVTLDAAVSCDAARLDFVPPQFLAMAPLVTP